MGRKRKAADMVAKSADPVERQIDDRVIKPLENSSMLRQTASKLAEVYQLGADRLKMMAPPHPDYSKVTKCMNSLSACALCVWSVPKGAKRAKEYGMRVGSPTWEELDTMGYAVLYVDDKFIGAMHSSCAMIAARWAEAKGTPIDELEKLMEDTRAQLSRRTCLPVTKKPAQETINVSEYDL